MSYLVGVLPAVNHCHLAATDVEHCTAESSKTYFSHLKYIYIILSVR